jgi:hypothetical protein
MIEDVEEYGRVHEIFSLLQSSARRYNAHAEGWGSTDDHSSTFNDPGEPDEIPANSARTVVVKLLSSFLTQGKAIPLNMVPVVIKLELGGADDAFAALAIRGISLSRASSVMCSPWTTRFRTATRVTSSRASSCRS